MDFKTKWLFLFFFSLSSLHAQVVLKGKVTDKKNHPLAFVNIQIFDRPTEGTTTDIDGKFVIRSQEKIRGLVFSYVGYETYYLDLESTASNKFLDIKLEQSAIAIDAIEIVAGENPAHRIIRRAVKMRDKNNPEKLDGYRCRTYNKLVFDLVPNAGLMDELSTKQKEQKPEEEEEEESEKQDLIQLEMPEGEPRMGVPEMDRTMPTPSLTKKQLEQLERLGSLQASANRSHLFIIESVSERIFKAPKDLNEVVINNRAAGFSEPAFAALANAVQPFTFYQDHLKILDNDYLNPVSPGSTNAYYFNIEDTLYQGQDSIYILSYQPRKGKNFEGLKGLLYIHTNNYAIQSVIAQPVNLQLINIKIEQQYQLIDGVQWFPKALNFEVFAENYPTNLLGMKANGRTYVDSVAINPDLKKFRFKRDTWRMGDDPYERSDSLWESLRHKELTIKEERTYAIVDSIGEENDFDKFMKWAGVLGTGRYPLGKVDFMFTQMGISEYEVLRLGAGFGTNDKLSKYFNIELYGAYGIRDKGFKYGGTLTVNILDDERLEWSASYKKDIVEPAMPLPEGGDLFGSRFYAKRMSRVEEKRIAIKGRPFSFLEGEVALSQNDWEPGYDYALFEGDDFKRSFSFTEIQVNARYAFGEQYFNFMGMRTAREMPYPVLTLSYSKGLDGWLGGEYDFHRIAIGLEQSFLVRRFGTTTYKLEAGYTNNPDLPYNRLFASNTFNNDSYVELINNTFQTLRAYEFLSDRFVHLFIRHDFKSLLFRTEKFQPRLSLIHNIGFGTLKNKKQHRSIPVRTMEKGFFESGVRLGNLIRIPVLNFAYVGFGAGVYHRYGPYTLPDFWENTSVNLAIDFSF